MSVIQKDEVVKVMGFDSMLKGVCFRLILFPEIEVIAIASVTIPIPPICISKRMTI